MSQLPHDCFNFVSARHPTTDIEVAEIASEFAKDQARFDPSEMVISLGQQAIKGQWIMVLKMAFRNR